MHYQKIIDERNRSSDFATNAGIRILQIEDGYACGELIIKKSHKNPVNAVHGGAIFTIADMVGASAIAFCGHKVVTLDGNINFLNAAINVEKLVGEARIIKRGKTTIVANVDVTDEKGTLIASTTFTYYVLKKVKIMFDNEA